MGPCHHRWPCLSGLAEHVLLQVETELGAERWVVCSELAEGLAKRAKVTVPFLSLGGSPASQLEGLSCQHPFGDRQVKVHYWVIT